MTRYHGVYQSFDYDDLVQEGCIGAMDALSRYDPARNTDPWKFVQHRVKGRMQDALREWDWVPRKERHEEKNGGPDPVQMTPFSSYTRDIDHSDEFHTSRENWLYLDQPDPHSNDMPLIDGHWSYETEVAMRRLSRRQRELLHRYFIDGLTMKQIAAELRRTESRVSQMMTDALAVLRERMKHERSTPSACGVDRPAGDLRGRD